MEYFSTSLGLWVPAVVQGFNEESGTYKLDIHLMADPAKVRGIEPRMGVKASAIPAANLLAPDSSTQGLSSGSMKSSGEMMPEFREEQAESLQVSTPEQVSSADYVPPHALQPSADPLQHTNPMPDPLEHTIAIPVPEVPTEPVLHTARAGEQQGGEPQSRAVSRAPLPTPQVPSSAGQLGASLGIPCVMCFGEEGALKTLHCQYKVHKTCLRDFWERSVVRLGRVADLPCPAECAGCDSKLTQKDLLDVVSEDDIQRLAQQIDDVDVRNQQLINELKEQTMSQRPMFECSICLIEHEVEGCCTLPCQHRFCFESLQYHFDIIVKERRLNKLTCPAEGCNFNLRSVEHIHIFQQCLPEASYHKLLEFLARDDEHIYECQHLGCEERVFLDDGDDFADLQCPRGHRFCGKCANGPHPGVSCEEQQRIKQDDENDASAWESAMALGWKPCPKKCSFGGGYKESAECDHVTCECGHQFCWACGVDRQVPLAHDNRWHKPSCPYHTKYCEVSEAPRWLASCPACQKMPRGRPCAFPADDGYPQSYVPHRARARTTRAAEVGLVSLEITDVRLTANAAFAEFHVLISLNNGEQRSVRKQYRELLGFFSFFEPETGFPPLPFEEDERTLAEDSIYRDLVQGQLNSLIRFESVLKSERFRHFFDLLEQYEHVYWHIG